MRIDIIRGRGCFDFEEKIKNTFKTKATIYIRFCSFSIVWRRLISFVNTLSEANTDISDIRGIMIHKSGPEVSFTFDKRTGIPRTIYKVFSA